MAKEDLEDHRGAIKDYKKAIEMSSEVHGYWYHAIGFNYMSIDKYRGAIRFFNKTIEHEKETLGLSVKSPSNLMLLAFYNRGLAKIYMGNKEEGCLDLSKAGEKGYEGAYKAIQKLCNN